MTWTELRGKLAMMRNDGCHVLLVEDDENDAFLLLRAFRKSGLGHSVFRVADGTDAVDYLDGTDPYSDRARYPFPHLLLMDLKMQKMGGFDVLEWLRRRPDLKRVHVVVLSSSSIAADITKARELGAQDYRIKPVGFEELVRLVHDLLSAFQADQPSNPDPGPRSGMLA